MSPSSTHVVADSRAVLAKHGRTFNLAGRLLPSAHRDDAAVVYALCRLADDLADDAPNARIARAELDTLESELRGETSGRPVVEAFLEVCQRKNIDPQAANYLLRGLRSDLEPVSLQSDEELIRYSYCVAGTVGLMMCGVIGVTDQAALPHAIDLGIGMQITNICRDVLEDAERGRVYLPNDRLINAGTSAEALLSGDSTPEAIRMVVIDLLQLAEAYYQSADDGMHYIPWRARTAIMCASRMYREIGRRIVTREIDVMAGRTWVPMHRKIGLIWQGLCRSPFVRAEAHQASLHQAIEGFPGAA